MLYSQAAYAGFFVRLAATILDTFITGLFVALIYIFSNYFGPRFGLNDFTIAVTAVTLSALTVCYYYVVLPITKLQGTLGKHVFAICITDKLGTQISFWRSLGRFLAYGACWLPMVICAILLPGGPGQYTIVTMGLFVDPLGTLSAMPYITTAVFLTLILPPYSLLLIGFSKHKTALHDKIANTRVSYKYNL